MKPRCFFAIPLMTILFPGISDASEHKARNHISECIVLLHGLGRTKYSMAKIERYLKKMGFKVVNLSYPSTSEDIEYLAEEYIPRAIEKCQGQKTDKIHFVTHSLGGIVIRQYLQAHSLPPGSRIVMLSPPNKGTELADFLKEIYGYRLITGPAGQEIGTGPESLPNRLKPIDMQIGIITGDKSLNPLYSKMIPGSDDGKVSVESAKLEEMTDFLVIPCSHTFIMRNPVVMRQVAFFLENGRFDHSVQ
jgi:triacylglycerol lipase